MSEKGKIKKITDKGFGFIKYSGGEIFFHLKDITPPSDREKIAEGMDVEFDIGKGKEGKPAAKNVRIKSQHKGQDIRAHDDIKNINYFLPKDTYETTKSVQIDNFNLLLNKKSYFEDDKFIFYKRDRRNEIINLAKQFRINNSFLNILNERLRESIFQLLGNNNIKKIQFSPEWRLIVGIGHESVYETSITLHHIYGIPYIPGQAVKGVARSWIITEVFGQDEKEALKDRLFCHIFGSPKESAKGEHQGLVLFFDVFPVSGLRLEVDIMNPHYGDYYQGKEPPADYLNPTPIPFLTVGKDTKFEFIVGMKKLKTARDILGDSPSPVISKSNDLTLDSPLHEIALSWVKKALTEHGIGAKTAVGYGYFRQ